MTVDFEGTKYQCSITHPFIPYTLYVHEDHLLLVPSDHPAKIHKEFPAGDHTRRFTLRLSDKVANDYKQKYNREPKFVHRHADFGYEEDEGVVVCALLPGSNMIPYWDFRTMVKSEDTVITKHFTDRTSDPEAGFGLMKFDLASSLSN